MRLRTLCCIIFFSCSSTSEDTVVKPTDSIFDLTYTHSDLEPQTITYNHKNRISKKIKRMTLENISYVRRIHFYPKNYTSLDTCRILIHFEDSNDVSFMEARLHQQTLAILSESQIDVNFNGKIYLYLLTDEEKSINDFQLKIISSKEQTIDIKPNEIMNNLNDFILFKVSDLNIKENKFDDYTSSIRFYPENYDKKGIFFMNPSNDFGFWHKAKNGERYSSLAKYIMKLGQDFKLYMFEL